MAEASTVTISVCIASCQRPQGLARLLDSLAGQDPAIPPFEVVVIDNDSAGTAGPVVAAARAKGLAVSYAIEPVRNIARARNRSLDIARAPFVAFIDDDETASKDWLQTLYAALLDYAADGVFGSVEPFFAAGPPEWVRAGCFFLDCHRTPGTPLAWFETRTSNALLRRDAFAGAADRFDEAFGETGGGDCAVFDAMIRAGRKLVAAPGAIVFETIPPHRMRLAWLIARYFRNGNIHWRITRSSLPRHRGFIELFGDLTETAIHALKASCCVPVDRGRAARNLCEAAFYAGRIGAAMGYNPRPYAAGQG